MNLPVELVKGGLGQFDVNVDGRTVVTRKGGLIAKLTGRPWPTDDAILSAVSAATQSGAK
ncbi:MAG TPA: hypothetical protein VL284_09765 [Thermoanaerobaculia bacterium]|nr:hypothetical protein [Thermoanaerobaculia bacterium]